MKRRTFKAKGYTIFWLLLGAALLVLMAFAYGVGSSAPEVAQVIADAQHRSPNQFDMVIESRQTNPPEARSGTALPIWIIILFFGVLSVFALWQGANLLGRADRLARGIKQNRSRPLPPSPWQIQPDARRPLPGRPLEPLPPLLTAPEDEDDDQNAIDDIGWA